MVEQRFLLSLRSTEAHIAHHRLAKLSTLAPPAVRVPNLQHEELDEWVHASSERLVLVGEAAHPLPVSAPTTYLRPSLNKAFR